MFDLRGVWRRHRRKVFVTLGVIGGGYALYKLYDAHRTRALDLVGERRVDEIIKTQLQTHFEGIQRISDTTTLPYALHYLRSRMSEELDLSLITDRLMHGKEQPSSLTAKEKLELWERLKILSFTKTASSLWAMTMLCLYVRVQVNILGRHLYVETARGLGSSLSLDNEDSLSSHGQQEFLATADFLSTYGISSLILNMQKAVLEVLKEKQLKDLFNVAQLRETIIRILESFMSFEESNYWLGCLLPEDATTYRQLMVMSSNGSDNSSFLMDISKLEQLMAETRTVLSSPDFRNIAELSLRKMVDMLLEEIASSFSSTSSSDVPLARLLPRVAQLSSPMLVDPTNNKFIHTIQSMPEVEIFYTLLYSNMPPVF
ncbi:hypothetical protein J5N97_027879 [Dioscorea zingiberensis]|uniref:Peroxin-3 n=1 Tax=Dioscorea zingiberensis TaxID=325984 RepID=A0A9D5BYC6_9LILI|nr:hypothetical protein J5N97_027879 [Dioscorea zingiberensis]